MIASGCPSSHTVDGAAVSLEVGETTLEFRGAAGEPFYHVALLVPGDRFAAALDWAGGHVELLPERETGESVFDFANWDAKALYFHDPAGNIVELIAHRGVGETGTTGAFTARELLGLSEVGLVGDPPALAAELERVLGLEVWSGTVAGGGPPRVRRREGEDADPLPRRVVRGSRPGGRPRRIRSRSSWTASPRGDVQLGAGGVRGATAAGADRQVLRRGAGTAGGARS